MPHLCRKETDMFVYTLTDIAFVLGIIATVALVAWAAIAGWIRGVREDADAKAEAKAHEAYIQLTLDLESKISECTRKERELDSKLLEHSLIGSAMTVSPGELAAKQFRDIIAILVGDNIGRPINITAKQLAFAKKLRLQITNSDTEGSITLTVF